MSLLNLIGETGNGGITSQKNIVYNNTQAKNLKRKKNLVSKILFPVIL